MAETAGYRVAQRNEPSTGASQRAASRLRQVFVNLSPSANPGPVRQSSGLHPLTPYLIVYEFVLVGPCKSF